MNTCPVCKQPAKATADDCGKDCCADRLLELERKGYTAALTVQPEKLQKQLEEAVYLLSDALQLVDAELNQLEWDQRAQKLVDEVTNESLPERP